MPDFACGYISGETDLRVVGGIVLGFLGATAAITALSFAGLDDPAVVGTLHIVLWVLFAIGFTRNTTKTVKTGSTTTPTNNAESPRDQGVAAERYTPASLFETEATAATPSEPPIGEHEGRTRKLSWPKATAVVISFAALLGTVALSGFLGAKYAVGQASTTTTQVAFLELSAPTEADPGSWNNLTNVEKVWCTRDRSTKFAMYWAARNLDLLEFSTNIIEYRDGDAAATEGLMADFERWSSQGKAGLVSHSLAIACRAAFAGR
jgi:hypothetical protein